MSLVAVLCLVVGLLLLLGLVCGLCVKYTKRSHLIKLHKVKALSPIDSTITVPMPEYNVEIYDNFLSDAEIEYLKSKTTGIMTPSRVYASEQDLYSNHSRSSEQAWLTPDTTMLKNLRKRFSALVKTNSEQHHYEDLQVVRYPVGGFFTPHYDACQGTPAFCERMNGNNGPRYITILCYLNTVEAGGETVFPKINKTVQAVKGRCVVFYNVHADGRIITESLHGGNPVLAGEKWICNQWIRL